MKDLPRYSRHQEIEDNPSKPFIEDIEKDLIKIDKYYNDKQALSIKIKMIQAITENIEKN